MTPREIFLSQIRLEKTRRKPVWFMRQVGRYQRKYRKIRERYSLWEICDEPELCAETTMIALDFDFDALIIFSDIMYPFRKAGMDVQLVEREGPVVRSFSPDMLERVSDDVFDNLRKAMGIVRREVPDRALLGFAGGPFTIAVYLLGDRDPKRNFSKTKVFILKETKTWYRIAEKLSDIVSRQLVAQQDAGADAVQIFDSWAGSLSRDMFKKYYLDFLKSISSALKVPKIYFCISGEHIFDLVVKAGFDVISLDWRQEIGKVRRRYKRCVQGNLDPAFLFAPRDVLRREILRILSSVHSGHIFNLGHGVPPSAPEESVRFAVEVVKSYEVDAEGGR